MKFSNIHNKTAFILAGAIGIFLTLAGCSSDDAAQVIADEFIAVSGQITDTSGTGVQDVNVEGVYSDPGGLLNPVDTTDTNGSFSLQILKNDAFYLRATSSTLATMNSAKAAFSANVTGLDIGIPTEAEAQAIIDTAFAVAPPVLANHAWLVIDIVNATTGDELNNKAVSTSVAPTDEVYTDCAGADSGGGVTAGAPCAGGRVGPMYIAYFDAPAEVNVTVDSTTQIAPIRMGEITFLEFEL